MAVRNPVSFLLLYLFPCMFPFCGSAANSPWKHHITDIHTTLYHNRSRFTRFRSLSFCKDFKIPSFA